MRSHELKTWPGPFEAVLSGRKHHEVRRDDRGFVVGDEVVLREWDPEKGTSWSEYAGYTGRRLTARVTYITEAGTWGLPDYLCVLSIEVLRDGGRALLDSKGGGRDGRNANAPMAPQADVRPSMAMENGDE